MNEKDYLLKEIAKYEKLVSHNIKEPKGHKGNAVYFTAASASAPSSGKQLQNARSPFKNGYAKPLTQSVNAISSGSTQSRVGTALASSNHLIHGGFCGEVRLKHVVATPSPPKYTQNSRYSLSTHTRVRSKDVKHVGDEYPHRLQQSTSNLSKPTLCKRVRKRGEEKSLLESLENISSIYKSLVTGVQKTLSTSQAKEVNENNSRLKQPFSKVTVHKSRTRVLNQYLPKTKKSVFKSSTKLVNKYVTPSNRALNWQDPRKYTTSNSYHHTHPSRIVNDDGQLYKNTHTHPSKLADFRLYHSGNERRFSKKHSVSEIKTDQVKHVQIRGVQFLMSGNGQKLRRICDSPVSSTRPQTPSTPKRLRVGDSVFVRRSNAEYIKKSDMSIQKLASRKIVRSMNVIRQKNVKCSKETENSQAQCCVFYSRFGRCSKGSDCKFLHDPKQIAVCTRFLKGKCNATNCVFAHEICENKMPVCRYFVESFCTKDPCPYLHVNVGRQAPLCPDFQLGYCSKGRSCPMQHVFACKDFKQNGVCTRGKDCKYSHFVPRKYQTSGSSSVRHEEKVKGENPGPAHLGSSSTEDRERPVRVKYDKPTAHRRIMERQQTLPASRFQAFLALPGSDTDEESAEDGAHSSEDDERTERPDDEEEELR